MALLRHPCRFITSVNTSWLSKFTPQACNALYWQDDPRSKHSAGKLLRRKTGERYNLQDMLPEEIDVKRQPSTLHLTTISGARATRALLETASGGPAQCPSRGRILWCQVDKDTLTITAKDPLHFWPCKFVGDVAETTCPSRGCYKYLQVTRECEQSSTASKPARFIRG